MGVRQRGGRQDTSEGSVRCPIGKTGSTSHAHKEMPPNTNPHRTQDRFYKAKHDAQHACEDLRAKIQRSNIHDAVRHELLRAVDAAESQINEVALTRSHPGSRLRDITKDVGHLQVAETWLLPPRTAFSAASAPDGPRSSRTAIDEAVDTVMWHIRVCEWDGRPTPAVTELQRAVQEAEAQAALRQAG